jgi:hypothetical protein
MERLMLKGFNMTMPHGAIQSLRRWALAPAIALVLTACGGGEPDVPQAGAAPGPATFAVAAPPPPPVMPGDSTGATQANQTGTLHYMVFGAVNVAGGWPSGSVGTITRDATKHDISLPALSSSLVIRKDLTNPAAVETWSGVPGNGGVLNMPWPAGSGGGLLSNGNFLVYCAGGTSSQVVLPAMPASELYARINAYVFVSGNFVGMNNIAPLYGKTFKRFDCTDSAPNTTFGDRNGNLTMAFGALSLSPADVVAAFSSAGFSIAGSNYKRRAYQITINGETQYAIVALDTDALGNPTASVLYRYN